MKLKKLLKGAVITGGAMFVLKGLDNRLETTHYVIESRKIPKSFDGFRIVQVSDFHASPIAGITEEIRGEDPDIIVMTGDLVHDRGSYEPGILFSERLAKIAPTYNVTGNHDLLRTDYTKYQYDLDKTGVVTLHDESITLDGDDGDITLSGIEDPFSEDDNTISQNVAESLRHIPSTDNFHIVLFHRANHMDLLKDAGFNLILSGHMHGGQVRLPDGRGVCSPKSSWGDTNAPMFFPKYFGGHYRYKNTDMIVNRGIGNPMIIPRLFNRPEVTVIILKHKELNTK